MQVLGQCPSTREEVEGLSFDFWLRERVCWLPLISTVSLITPCPWPTSPTSLLSPCHFINPFSVSLLLLCTTLWTNAITQSLLPLSLLPQIRSCGDAGVELAVWWYYLLMTEVWRKKTKVKLLSGLRTKDGPWVRKLDRWCLSGLIAHLLPPLSLWLLLPSSVSHSPSYSWLNTPPHYDKQTVTEAAFYVILSCDVTSMLQHRGREPRRELYLKH